MTRAQLMEFTAESATSSRKAVSPNAAFTRSWQSSNVPGTDTACALAEFTVLIWRRCTSETRPSGNRMKMSTRCRSRQASMAADPVSPEVAPRMQTRSSRSSSTWSNRRPTSCSATSLNASVGPR